MKVYLIRHGETTANVARKFSGHTDVELTLQGQIQALRLSSELENIRFDEVYTSDLKRAVHTAELLLGDGDHPEPVRVPEFREKHFGDWEMKTFREVREKDSRAWEESIVSWDSYRTSGGESGKEFFERVITAFRKIMDGKNLDEDKNILIVSHCGVVQCLLSYLCYGDSSGYWRFEPKNCRLNMVEYVQGYPIIKIFNK